jgi:hypothetical protein
MYRRRALDAWIREQERSDSRSNSALNPLAAPLRHKAGRVADA